VHGPLGCPVLRRERDGIVPTEVLAPRYSSPTSPLVNVRARVRAAGWDACVVVNEHRIVMGLLRAEQLGREGGLTAESAVRPGPSTFRPNVAIDEMAESMAKRNLPNAPVTTSAGELIGLLVREDAERAAHERHEQEPV